MRHETFVPIPNRQWRTKPEQRRLEAARDMAHAAFDLLWKTGHMSKRKAYHWLEREFGMARDSERHMSRMTYDQCRRVVELCMRKALGDVSDLV